MSQSGNNKQLQDLFSEKDSLNNLLEAYGEADQVQQPDISAQTDAQLKSFALILEEYIREHVQGTVLDIGFGGGILLRKLSTLPAFCDNRKWLYVGVDFSTRHEDLLKLALNLRLQRRSDVIDLDKFYSSWIDDIGAPNPLLIVVRNVLHELSIEATVKLFYTLHHNATPDDIIVIQDLLVFPRVERGNVCWDTSCLKKAIAALGFETFMISEPSKSGAQWFTAKLKRRGDSPPLQQESVLYEVINGRMQQLQQWRAVKKLTLEFTDQRPSRMAMIDFDLQLVGLFEQLVDANVLVPSQRDETTTASVSDAFSLIVRSYDPDNLSKYFSGLPSITNFRNRAHSQDALESFLNSDSQIVVIRGGAFCGKSVLVSHVLQRRAHGRTPILLDCRNAQSVWPLLEQYLLGSGCEFSFEVMRGTENFMFRDVVDELAKLIDIISPRSIVVFDHFESILDPNGYITDNEVVTFLKLLAENNMSKLIITTRMEPNTVFLSTSVRFAPPQPSIGRFPEGPHTENLLDDYVDRLSLGLKKYPAELLKAIDRYPYLATLTGKLITKEGVHTLSDPEVIQIIELLLYDELAARIITPSSYPALSLAATLRIPTPRSLFHGIVGRESTNQAEQTGLLYSIPDRYRDDLLDCAIPIRDVISKNVDRETESEGFLKIREYHEKIARWYSMVYNDDEGDPRWIREAHYHMLAAGDRETIKRFGRLYGAELLWTGIMWFRQFRDYEAAYEALLAAEKFGFVTYDSRRILASCMIRTRRRAEGDQRYQDLIKEFFAMDGPKTSYVDSLLSIHECQEAINVLRKLGLNIDNENPWIAGQYGRAYMGLHQYKEAANAFFCQLNQSQRPDGVVYIRLAQCYYRIGERRRAKFIIENGLKFHPQDTYLNTLYSAILISLGTPEALRSAEAILERILNKSPRSAHALIKILKIYELTERKEAVIQKIRDIDWVVPSNLIDATRIAADVALGDFEEALRKFSISDLSEDYREALFRKLYLSWVRSGNNEVEKKNIARIAIHRKIPEKLQTNVPILAMQAQLAAIADNEGEFNKSIELIRNVNPDVAIQISDELGSLDLWDDVEALM